MVMRLPRYCFCSLHTVCKCSVCIKYAYDILDSPKYIQHIKQTTLCGILFPIMHPTWLELPFPEWPINDFQSCFFHIHHALILTLLKDKAESKRERKLKNVTHEMIFTAAEKRPLQNEYFFWIYYLYVCIHCKKWHSSLEFLSCFPRQMSTKS